MEAFDEMDSCLIVTEKSRFQVDPVNVQPTYKALVIYEDFTSFKVWNAVIMLLMLFIIVYLPLTFAFKSIGENKFLNNLDNILNYIFLCDVILNFFITYKDHNQIEVDSLSLIAVNYLKSWFIIDFFSSLPMEAMFATMANAGNYNNLGKLLKLPKLYKILRFGKIVKILKAMKYNKYIFGIMGNYKFSPYTISIVVSILWLLAFSHLFSCLMITFSKNNQNNWWTVFKVSWPDFSDDMEVWSNQLAVSHLYIFQTLTTVGYGDVYSGSLEDYLFKFLIMFLGVYLYSYITSTSINYVMSESLARVNSRSIKQDINHMVDRYQLNYKSEEHLLKLFKRRMQFKAKDDYNFIYELAPKNREYVLQHIYGFFTSKIEIFDGKSFNFFESSFNLLMMRFYNIDEYLWEKGEKALFVYFIVNGSVSFRSSLLKTYNLTENGSFKVYDKGDVFGLDEAFINHNCLYECITEEESEIYYMDTDQYYALYDKFNMTKEIFSQTVEDFTHWVNTELAIMLVLHLFKSINYYYQNYDLMHLINTYKVIKFGNPNLRLEKRHESKDKNKINKEESFMAHLNLLCKRYKIDLDGYFPQPYFNNKYTNWYDYYLIDSNYKDLMEDLNAFYMKKLFPLYILKNYLVKHKFINDRFNSKIDLFTLIEHGFNLRIINKIYGVTKPNNNYYKKSKTKEKIQLKNFMKNEHEINVQDRMEGKDNNKSENRASEIENNEMQKIDQNVERVERVERVENVENVEIDQIPKNKDTIATHQNPRKISVFGKTSSNPNTEEIKVRFKDQNNLVQTQNIENSNKKVRPYFSEDDRKLEKSFTVPLSLEKHKTQIHEIDNTKIIVKKQTISDFDIRKKPNEIAENESYKDSNSFEEDDDLEVIEFEEKVEENEFDTKHLELQAIVNKYKLLYEKTNEQVEKINSQVKNINQDLELLLENDLLKIEFNKI